MWQNISMYICGIITTIEVIIFGILVIDEKSQISKRKILTTILLVALTNSIIYTLLTETSKTLLMFLVDICLYKKLFKIPNKKSIFITFLYMIILLVSDLLTVIIAINILNIDKSFYYNQLAGSIIGNIIICIVFVFITYILRNILKKLINAKIENNIKIIIFSILISICVFMFFYTLIKEFRFSDNIVMYLIAIVVLLIVLFSLIKQVIENNKLMSRYDKLLEFMTTYENEIEKQRVLRHETKNEFLSIRGKIHDKQANKEIIAYIDEILKDKIEVKQEEYAKFGYLPPNGIKGLCYLKMQEAQDKGLETKVNISKRVSNSNVYNLNIKEQRDLGKILGVFLDNAIEASLKSDAKKFGIEGYLNKEKECELIISNSFTEQIDLEKMGKERFSTKGKNRGHGLLLVNHIISQNKIFEIDTQVGHGIYVQKVTIKKEIENEETLEK